MNRDLFKQEFKKTLDDMYSIMEKKNADYSKDGAFQNFDTVEKLGVTTTEKGILVRMMDKITRICNLIDKEGKVEDEKITDTLTDLANYCVILKIYLLNKEPK